MNESPLVTPDGRPLRRAQPPSQDCPRCGAGKDKRRPSAGFGNPSPTCTGCGYVFEGERA